ncbi:hypothetical protein FISHEDRAFT_34260, partial [Fistulina hepatica ATCC 64428]
IDAFEIEVFVSGYASQHTPPDLASRSQRAFIQLAKKFAALPRLEGTRTPVASRSTEQLHLPPRPDEIMDETEFVELERQRKNLGAEEADLIDFDSDTPPSTTPNSIYGSTTPDASLVQRWHDNLEARLRPFLSSVVATRPVQLHLYAPGSGGRMLRDPVASTRVMTSQEGSFQTVFRLRWEDLCQHPATLQVAFGDAFHEYVFRVVTELLPPPSPPPPSSGTGTTSSRAVEEDLPYPSATASIDIPLSHARIRVISDIDDTVKRSDVSLGARAIFRNVFVTDLVELTIPGMADWYASMWSQGARFHYVSNGPFEILPVLYDFFNLTKLPPAGSVKLRSYAGKTLFSGLLKAPAARKRGGVQEVLDAFPDSKFILIGDSGEQDIELYTGFAVSRPEQIIGVFIRDVTTGDVLDDPTGESMTTPASAVQFSSRPASRVPSPSSYSPSLPPPQSSRASSSSSSSSSYTPGSATVNTGNQFFTSNVPFTSEPELTLGDDLKASTSTASTSARVRSPRYPPPRSSRSRSPARPTPSSSSLSNPVGAPAQRVTEQERRRYELQIRVYRARAQIPSHIPFRIFRDPKECHEAVDLFQKYSRT